MPDDFLEDIAARNSWATYHESTLKSEEGRSIPHLHLSNSSSVDGNPPKIKVWLQGGVHGNEPAGDQALLALIGKMDDNQSWALSLLNHMDIVILPRYNLDGVKYFQRTSASNFDLNRDHIKLASEQTRSIRELFNDFALHVAVDMHEFSAPAKYGGSFVHAADALFSAAKNLNINSGIRKLSEELFVLRIGAALESAGLRWEPYVTGTNNSNPGSPIKFDEACTDAKIGRNGLGLTQCISLLCETRGIGLADQHFQRRTITGLVMAEAILQTIAENHDEVLRTVQNGINSFVNGSDGIVITDSSTVSDRTFQMIDIRDGSIVNAPVRFASTTPSTANLIRARPEAYFIPAAWSDIAQRMRVSGLEVVTLPQPCTGRVEALNITSLEFGNTYLEGIVPVTVTTSTVQTDIALPAGSFYVSTRQRNAALAFVALEPENVDSYVATNIIPVEVGDEYPIYRLMSRADCTSPEPL